MFLGVRQAFLPYERLLNQVVKFLSLCSCSQISVGAHAQIIGEPIGAEMKVLKSQTHTYKLGRVCYVAKEFSFGQNFRR